MASKYHKSHTPLNLPGPFQFWVVFAPPAPQTYRLSPIGTSMGSSRYCTYLGRDVPRGGAGGPIAPPIIWRFLSKAEERKKKKERRKERKKERKKRVRVSE